MLTLATSSLWTWLGLHSLLSSTSVSFASLCVHPGPHHHSHAGEAAADGRLRSRQREIAGCRSIDYDREDVNGYVV